MQTLFRKADEDLSKAMVQLELHFAGIAAPATPQRGLIVPKDSRPV